jgi:putative hydrolase of the HAD superfamily
MNLVFDFGAVVFTWQPAHLLAEHYPQWVAHHGTAQQLAHDLFHHPDWLAFDRGTLAQDEVVTRTAQRLRWSHADVHSLVTGVGRNLQPIAPTVDVLAKLVQRRAQQDNVRLYYLSNMPVPLARTLEHLHDFLDWFDGGVFSGDVGQIKPEPGIYQLLQSRYQLEPARTVFVDDLQANVEAARAHGWHAVQFTSAEQLTQDLAAWGV